MLCVKDGANCSWDHIYNVPPAFSLDREVMGIAYVIVYASDKYIDLRFIE